NRTNRGGLSSVYTVLLPNTESTPEPYEQKIRSIVKGCEDSPAGFSEDEGGFIYYVEIEDDGADETGTVEGLAGAIAGTAAKQGQNAGVGVYAVATDDKVTQAEITSFVTSNPTATVELVGSTESICNNSSVTNIAWVAGDECNAQTVEYKIQLNDDDCGNDRLEELQSAYPDLTIAIADNDDLTSSEVTVTGTSGAANITIDGTDYLARFGTDLATTAANFVTTHAADSQAATGQTVTSALAVITFE